MLDLTETRNSEETQICRFTISASGLVGVRRGEELGGGKGRIRS